MELAYLLSTGVQALTCAVWITETF